MKRDAPLFQTQYLDLQLDVIHRYWLQGTNRASQRLQEFWNTRMGKRHGKELSRHFQLRSFVNSAENVTISTLLLVRIPSNTKGRASSQLSGRCDTGELLS
ncbi:hypothetical protein NPIL_327571 [Nephila pilipes]|uniref:Uncharacterized protein n=1 Tax=Nephila pilipes TaxID=299642 RepID=A0A8X6UQT1_NEPPI|nr:hypothetical protein NPIL_327571 [Nephila pilipes]